MADGAWWEEPGTDWTRNEPKRALELLSHAYDERSAIKHIIQQAGIDWRRAPSAPASAWDVWVWALQAGAKGGLVLDLVSTVLSDPNVAAFHGQLKELVGSRIAHVNARTLARRGMSSEGVAAGAVLENLGATVMEPGSALTEGLQAVLDARSGLPDPRAYVQPIVDAMRRTALIEIGGQPTGTAFLVGDDLMITAAHVLDRHNWPPKLTQPVEAVFDFYASGYRAPAEVGSRVRIVEFLVGSLPTVSEARHNSSDWDAEKDWLDFALMQLERRVAVERGPKDDWPDAAPRGSYSIGTAEYDFAAATELMIVQHPLGERQALSRLKGPFSINRKKTRVRYQGNTLPGSSGSAVVDPRGRLVALHHFGNSSANQGIPISAIATMLEQGPHASLVRYAQMNTLMASVGVPVGVPSNSPTRGASPAIDPLSTHVFGRRPFVNRSNLRESVRGMLPASGKSVLVIEGGEGAGKSYSYRLLSHLANEYARSPELQALAANGIRAAKIDFDEYVRVPSGELRGRLVSDILAALEQVSPGDDSLAQAARDIRSLSGWLPKRLRDSGVLWWIFFDSLDRFVLGQDGVDELVFGLAKMVDQNPSIPLRVALVTGDRADKLPGDLVSWAERDSARPLNREDATGWLRARASSEGRTIDEVKLQEELSKIFPANGTFPTAESLAAQLARVLPRIVSGGT